MMNKRAALLERIKLAIADGDEKKAIRLYTEGTVSRAAFAAAVAAGRELQKNLNGRSVRDTRIADLDTPKKGD